MAYLSRIIIHNNSGCEFAHITNTLIDKHLCIYSSGSIWWFRIESARQTPKIAFDSLLQLDPRAFRSIEWCLCVFVDLVWSICTWAIIAIAICLRCPVSSSFDIRCYVFGALIDLIKTVRRAIASVYEFK